MSVTRLGLIGGAGRMGTALVAHLQDVADITIDAILEVGEDLEAFIGSQPDVVVDLSLGQAVAGHGETIVSRKLPYIVGATGIPQQTVDNMARLSVELDTPVLIVPNFSLGANLMIRFSAIAAGLMESPVITERHHPGKRDAPSGTALFTAGRIAEVSKARPTAQDSTEEHAAGVLGAEVDGVRIHSLRGAGFLAEQEVSLSLPGESLTVEHRSIDRRCFMPGIEYAIRNINRVKGLQTGLDTILEI